MVGTKPSIFWQITWRFISPLIVLVILIFYLVTQAQKKLTYLVWDPESVRNKSLNSHMMLSRFGVSQQIKLNGSFLFYRRISHLWHQCPSPHGYTSSYLF